MQYDTQAVRLQDLTPDPGAQSGRDHDAVYDRERLSEIDRLRAADVDHVQPLVQDLLAELAAATDMPVALLNVVLPGAQLLAGQHGLTGWLSEARATPLEWALCSRVVRQRAHLIIPQLAADPSTAHNPLHSVDGLDAYAGVPLTSSKGHILGAMCVLDTRRREFGPADVVLLEGLAATAIGRLEAAAVSLLRTK